MAKDKLSGSCVMDLATELVSLERRLMDLGLHKTAQKMQAATHTLGYEAAEKLLAAERKPKA